MQDSKDWSKLPFSICSCCGKPLRPKIGARVCLRSPDTVLDPMAGTSRFPIAACAKGFRGVAVELEENFCQMSRDNAAYASKKLGREIDLTVLQGDSRRLSELLHERGLVSVVSPPYTSAWGISEENSPEATRLREERHKLRHPEHKRPDLPGYYSDNRQNIGNLPDRPIVIVSPPYGEGVAGNLELLKKWSKEGGGLPACNDSYGPSLGQIANLPDKPLEAP